MTSRYFTPQEVVPFTRALASGVNVNLTGILAGFEQVQDEIDSGADILLRDHLADGATVGRGAALVGYGGETVKAVLDKLTNPGTLAAAGTLTGNESLALHNGTTLTSLTLNRLLYKDASGNVGLGVTPTHKLDVAGRIRGQSNLGALIASNGSGSGQTSVILRREGGPANQKDAEFLQASDGTMYLRFIDDTYTGGGIAMLVSRGTGAAVSAIEFYTQGNLRQHIDPTGYTSFPSTAGVYSNNLLLQGDGTHGYVRPNNGSSNLYLGASNNNYWAVQSDGHFRPTVDNAYALGVSTHRASVVFSATGTINTSDEREKTWRGKAEAAELRAARRIIAELGFYQWNDAIEEKGPDGARLHFGVRAQRAFAIFRDEGLDPHRYAFLCYDKWERQTKPVMATRQVTKTREIEVPSRIVGQDGQPIMRKQIQRYSEEEAYDTGEVEVTLDAGDRYGVRPDQLALFLIAALAAPTPRKRPAKRRARPKGQRGHE